MSFYIIDFTGIASTGWPDANSPAQFSARAKRILDLYGGRSPQIVRMARFTDEWFTDTTVQGEGDALLALALVERGGPITVTYHDLYGDTPNDPPEFPFNYHELIQRETRDAVDFVNQWLLMTVVLKDVGTNADWDMTLKGLIILLYRHGDRISREAYRHTLHTLFACINGPGKRLNWALVPIFFETENHVMMTESCRYLANQLLFLEQWQAGAAPDAVYDNVQNGLAKWLTEYCGVFLQHDFWEFNSKPYQRLTTASLQNLYDFAWDSELKQAARCALDYISAKTAVSSHGLRRAVPFRRLRENVGVTALFGHPVDAQTSRMLMLTGDARQLAFVERPGFAHVFSDDQMLHAALTTYRVPEIIVELIVNKPHNPYYQRFFHGDRFSPFPAPRNFQPGNIGPFKPIVIPGGVEIYAYQDDFLISAGGVWRPSGNGNYDEWVAYKDCANAIPTTLMPRAGADRADFIRIEGHPDFQKQVNTGVLPGFACGLNLVIPQRYRTINQTLIEQLPGFYVRDGYWIFINAGMDCPNPENRFGFHCAAWVYELPQIPKLAGISNAGFFEVASSQGRSFSDFCELVKTNNPPKKPGATPWSEYVTTDGRTIRFEFLVDGEDKLRWPIVGGDSNILVWPLARGNIINSRINPDDSAEDGHAGFISIDNPYHQQRLVLDMRDPVVPRRYQFRRNASRQTAGALVTRDVFRLDAFWNGPAGAVMRVSWDAYVHGGTRWSFPATLSPDGYAGRRSPFAAISRTSEETDLFWHGGDGSLWCCTWSLPVNGGEWCLPLHIPIADPGGKVSRASGIAAVSRIPDQVDVFWVAGDGSLWTHWRNLRAEAGDWSGHDAIRIAPAGSADPGSAVVAIARNSDHLDVFWLAADGSVRSTWWDAGGKWRAPFAITAPGAALPGGALSANARYDPHVDLFWITPNAAIGHSWWHPDFNNATWNPVDEIAPPQSASVEGGLVSLSRIAEQVDVFWITPTGSIASRFWNDRMQPTGWSPIFFAAPDNAASLDSSLSGVSRDPHVVDLIWTGPDRQLRTNWWTEGADGNWLTHQIPVLTPADSVRAGKVLHVEA